LLLSSGEELSVLSKAVNTDLNLRSRTKGYAYIAKVCKAGYAYKRRVNVNGKRVTKVYVKLRTQKAYNDLFALTIEPTKKVLRSVIENYLKEFSTLEQINQKIVNLSEQVIISVEDLIKRSSTKSITSANFIEKLSNEIRTTCNSELLRLKPFLKESIKNFLN